MKKSYNYPKFEPEDRCRFCVHAAIFHMSGQFFSAPINVTWDLCEPHNIDCDCPGYMPLDNLTYLELKQDEIKYGSSI